MIHQFDIVVSDLQTHNDKIASLVQGGLDPKIQKSLDAVRVGGNNAVHPGTIDEKDDTETVYALFGLVNIIADVMISQPKHVDELYQGIVSESQREAIEKRDDQR